MTIEPKLMDPDRLADYTSKVEECASGGARTFPVYGWGDMLPALAHAKHWESEADEADKRTVAHFEECERLRTVIEERERERLEVMRGTHDREDRERRELAMILGLEPRGETVMGLLIHVRVQLGAARLQIKKLRDRCPVEASDVEAAGVTYTQAIAWADAHDMEPCDPEMDTRDQPADYAMMRMRRRGDGPECDAVFELIEGVSDRSVAYSCNTLGRAFEHPAFDILAEMAAMDPS